MLELRYIFKKRIERLVKNNILKELYFINFNICLYYIEGNQTKHTKKNTIRSKKLIKIIYTDIYKPLYISYFNNEKYFITFIYNLLRYNYVYLIYKNVDTLNVHINKVKR